MILACGLFVLSPSKDGRLYPVPELRTLFERVLAETDRRSGIDLDVDDRRLARLQGITQGIRGLAGRGLGRPADVARGAAALALLFAFALAVQNLALAYERSDQPEKAAAAYKKLQDPLGPVLAALEVTLPPAASWARDADSPGIALDTDHGAIQQAMEMAAGRGASGEVILNAAILLQGQGAAAARSQVTATVIRALRAVNLKHEAKALALEALLGAADRPGG